METNASAAPRSLWRWAVQTARLCCGVPDYDVYVKHLREHHPERPVPSYGEFFRERQEARYRGTGGRCC
ncbi:YbdD/YjiX family protein [Luteibacter yeojuensis]|uniref:YbdD/YjiX family protein n=1 Tax=Luteibacter yeojuensis TaxID=345309 RepID=A0A7X5QXE4_9GAMM|nr:YbdD/YjiX family protein [Luteibacter yeojuensis]NID17091.1 YbdD/YjiX family protein [Luteibacter yeojuensis]